MITHFHEAQIQAHRKNIARYNRLLHTKLTEAERRYLHKRVAQERGEIDRLRREANQRADQATVVAALAMQGGQSGGGAPYA